MFDRTVKPSGPELMFWGRFLTTASISVLVIGLFIISISSCFSLGRLNFSKNLSISSRLFTFLQIVFIIVSYNPLCFCIVCCNLSFFISNFVDFSLLFLMGLATGLLILFMFSKNQFLVLLIFTIVSCISVSFISAWICMISFLLLILGFFCSSFSSCFKCKVRLPILFFLFLEVGLYCYKLPS